MIIINRTLVLYLIYISHERIAIFVSLSPAAEGSFWIVYISKNVKRVSLFLFLYFVLIYWKSDIVIVKCDFEQLIISGRLIFVFGCGYSRCVLLVTFRYFLFMILHYFCLISFCIFCISLQSTKCMNRFGEKLCSFLKNFSRIITARV